jgi:thioredoxin reductase (NADPH)
MLWNIIAVLLLKHLPLNLFEEVTNVKPIDGGYTITTSKATYQAKKVILSTGFYDIAVNLDIPGEDLPKVKHYYQDPHYYTSQKVVVVGSAAIRLLMLL